MASNIIKIEAPIPGADATGMIAEVTSNITSPTAVVFPSAVYNVSGRIPIPTHGIELIGTGSQGTQFNFNPATPGVLFDFENATPGQLNNCSLRNIGLVGSGTVEKVMIKATDVSMFGLDNVLISPNTSSGYDSIGIQLQGRNTMSMRKLVINADNPISIEPNPNWYDSPDMSRFSNLYLMTSNPTGAAIDIAPGCTIVNLKIDGFVAMSGGKYGLRWVDPAPEVPSALLSFENCRYEAPADPTGSFVYIDGPAINQVRFHNWAAAPGINGFYFRNINNLKLDSCFYDGTGEALNLDGTCSNIVLDSCYEHVGSTRSMTGLTRAFNQPPIEIWQPS